METSRPGGLALADAYYRDYGGRARVLSREGKRAIGYMSAVAPVEIITAAGFIPVRIKGDPAEAVLKAPAMMETLVCPYVLSAFDLALRGRYDYLEGMVIPHTCDSVTRTYEVWKRNFPLPYYHFLNVPHLDDKPSLEFLTRVLRTFIKSLEQAWGSTISKEGLARAVAAHNEQRQAVRGLYELRKRDKPAISGVEIMKLLTAVKALPVEESLSLIRQVVSEAEKRKGRVRRRPTRIMLAGDQIDDTTLVEIIENTGARVVMDDISVGSKIYFADVEETEDPIDGIARYYLKKVPLPTFVRGGEVDYRTGLELRFGYLRRFIPEFRVDGVVLLVYRYCDPYGLEVPAAVSYIESTGTPVLHLEDDYSASTPARLKTRVEAFLEILEGRRK